MLPYRMDDDQCARKNAQRFFDVVDPDYYEFEGKIKSSKFNVFKGIIRSFIYLFNAIHLVHIMQHFTSMPKPFSGKLLHKIMTLSLSLFNR